MYDDYDDEETRRRAQIDALGDGGDSGDRNEWHAPFLPGNPDNLDWSPPSQPFEIPPSINAGSDDPYANYNNGSPVDAPLQAGHGWQWDGSRWQQVRGAGIGFNAGPGSSGGGNTQPQQRQVASFQAPTFRESAPANYSGRNVMSASTGSVAQNSAISEQMRGVLSNRLTDLSKPINILEDPTYKAQTDAFNLSQSRGADRQRKVLAERNAAGGTLASGGFNTNVNQVYEKQAEGEAKYSADLAGQRLGERETQLNAAIQMARAVGQDDVALQLENEKAALAQAALQLQGELGRSDLSLRDRLGSGQLNLGLMNALMGNQQFYDSLGFNYAGLQNSMNRDAVIQALG